MNPRNILICVALATLPILSSAAQNRVDELGLVGNARAAAQAVQDKFPGVVFTSGLRTLDAQIRAMAANIYKSQNPNWIKKTYINTGFVRKLNQAVVANWDDIHDSLDDIISTLQKVFDGNPTDSYSISAHLTGRAFDVEPGSVDKDSLFDYVKTLPGFQKAFDKEGGLEIWHFQFMNKD